MNSQNVVIVFAKWPELGKCKTRIAKSTSNEFALEFSQACLSDLISHVGNSRKYNLVFGVDSQEEARSFELTYGYQGVLTFQIGQAQEKLTQSQKFNSLFSRLVGSKYTKFVLIPMDLPFLEENDLVEAFESLENKPYVVGPEFNGGIYLIGTRSPYGKNVFDGVRWSTLYSSEDFMLNCGKENTKVLKKRTDLNTIEEVMAARGGIYRHCPKLFDLLNENGYYNGKSSDNREDFEVIPSHLQYLPTGVVA